AWRNLNANVPGGILWLRPTCAHAIYLYIDNPAARDRTFNVEVQLGKEQVLCAAKGVVAPKKAKTVVKFTKPMPPKETEAGKQPAAGQALAGPPFQLILRLDDGKDVVETRTIPIGIMTPRDYAEASARYNYQTKQLNVIVQVNQYYI